jgi:hypothetical protein
MISFDCVLIARCARRVHLYCESTDEQLRNKIANKSIPRRLHSEFSMIANQLRNDFALISWRLHGYCESTANRLRIDCESTISFFIILSSNVFLTPPPPSSCFHSVAISLRWTWCSAVTCMRTSAPARYLACIILHITSIALDSHSCIYCSIFTCLLNIYETLTTDPARYRACIILHITSIALDSHFICLV